MFEGGFLGLDNIGVFDRSAPLPTGGYLEQADGTAWMALFCQNMLEIAVELAMTDGYTSGGGLGLGLTGAKRLSNEFDIASTPGKGTVVTLIRWK